MTGITRDPYTGSPVVTTRLPSVAAVGSHRSSMAVARETFYGYDEVHRARAEVVRVDDERSLARALRRLAGREVTVRGGGFSLDAQALGSDVALLLDGEGFAGVGPVELRRGRATVTAGAMATWRDVLAATSREGYVPTSTVTGGGVTVGGTVSSNCLSRFSGAWGEEGEAIERARVMLASGEVVTARPGAPAGSLERRLFEGVVGGLGGLGVVLDATYALRRVSSRRAPRVSTRFEPVGWRRFTWEDFTARVKAETLHARRAVKALGARAFTGPLPAGVRDAVSATAWFRRMGPRGLILRSRHVSTSALKPASLYAGEGFKRTVAEWALCHDPLADFAQTIFKSDRVLRSRSVDRLDPFTFFMDGNVAARASARACGNRLTSHQQTFMVPEREAAGFCAEVEAMTAALHPTILDLLYLRADRSGSLLSPLRDLDAFAVTLGYQTLNGDRLAAARRILKRLARRCADLGGRVSLVKNVYADDAVLRGMYSDGLALYAPLKRELDPRGGFTNGVLRRLLR